MKFAQLLLKPLWNLVLDHEYSFSACNVNFYIGLIPVTYKVTVTSSHFQHQFPLESEDKRDQLTV